MAKIFISYRRSDSHWPAHEIFERLKAIARKSKDKIFIDLESIKPGEDFVKSIERNVKGCDVLVAIIGPNWLNASNDNGGRRLDDSKDIVRTEIASAMKASVTVVPVLLDGARMPSERELPRDLQGLAVRNAINVRKAHFDEDTAQLALALGLNARRVKAVSEAGARKAPRGFWHSKFPFFLTWHKTILVALLPVLFLVMLRGITGEANVNSGWQQMVFLGSLYLAGFYGATRLLASLLHLFAYLVRLITKPRVAA
ncbi:MAG: toll/interleukin-1 receptor domain-containing protein [Pseudomonadota bacterium]